MLKRIKYTIYNNNYIFNIAFSLKEARFIVFKHKQIWIENLKIVKTR